MRTIRNFTWLAYGAHAAKITKDTLLPFQSVNSPTCSPASYEEVNWYSCAVDENAWYGVSKDVWPISAVESVCKEAGGELISILSEEIDQCAFYAMAIDPNHINEMIMYSGRYLDYRNTWAWCPDFETSDSCIKYGFDYTNWQLPTTGDCMGGYLETTSQDFSDYTWYRKPCKELRTRFMCRIDCDGNDPTPAPITTPVPPPTDAPVTTAVPDWTGERLAVVNSHTIYMYEIKDDIIQPDNDVRFIYSIPYPTKGHPYMVFNPVELAIELAGDFEKKNNNNHGFLTLTGNWHPEFENLPDGREHSAMVYSPEMGTLLIAGQGGLLGNDASMIQIYKPASWDRHATVNELPKLNHGRERHSALYHDGTIYVAGGYRKSIERLDVRGISSVSDLNGLSWGAMQDLKTEAEDTTMQMFGNYIYYMGKAGLERESKFLEKYSVIGGGSEVYDNTFNSPNAQAAAFISSNSLTVIGGKDRKGERDSRDAKVTETALLSNLQHFQYEQTNVADDLGGQLLAFTNIIIY